MPDQLQFPFASLDFPGRVNLGVEEVAKKLGLTPKHITDLIAEGKLRALDHRGLGSSRACYRIPIECYRDYIVRCLTTPTDRVRLLNDLPRATIVEIFKELKQLLAA